MDLRPYLPSTDRVERAAGVLNYQPFMLSDDVQTGVAYSFVNGGDPRVSPPLLFRRRDFEDRWDAITDANARLRAMYDDLLDEVATLFPGGSLLDVACNNGYFPVGAELRGMRGTGMDLGNHSGAVSLLNDALGTKAKFVHAGYDSVTHVLSVAGEFDVTVMSAIMCHLPDPLHFLAAAGRITRGGILFWGQVIDSEDMLVCFQPPHPDLSTLTKFPLAFNDNTRLSLGLFRESARQMGFKRVVRIEPRPTWLTELCRDRGVSLDREIHEGSTHMALLAVR